MKLCEFAHLNDGVWYCKECLVLTPSGKTYKEPPNRPCPGVGEKMASVPQTDKPSYVGPGTILHDTLGAWGFKETPRCPCRQMRTMMDNWGPDGCEQRLESDIVPYMVREFKRRRKDMEGMTLAARGIVYTTPDITIPVFARKLATNAIRQSRRSSPTRSLPQS